MSPEAMPTVLIVEDDQFTQELYRVQLQERGYHAKAVGDGEKALQEIRTSHPDVVLLDVMLPKLDGYDVLAKIKSDPEAANIPVIMLTNMGEPEDVERGLALGAADYLIKVTSSPKQVINKITQVLASHAWQAAPILVKIDPTESETGRLAEAAGLPSDLSCRSCGRTLALQLRPQPFHPGSFTAALVCVGCAGDH